MGVCEGKEEVVVGGGWVGEEEEIGIAKGGDIGGGAWGVSN